MQNLKICRRLIEVDLPIKRISEYARKDQNVRKGHLHNMHVWWASRPLASCRAVLMATLLPDPEDQNCFDDFKRKARNVLEQFTGKNLTDDHNLRIALLNFIAEYSAWENSGTPVFNNAAKELILAAHPWGSPLVLDPFAGAGSIPFESLRIGAQPFAGDLNPIPILLNKVSIEYLPKYNLELVSNVRKWGQWILKEAHNELSDYYPQDSNKGIPLTYLWARTIRCEGPGCGAEIPLIGLLWLSRKVGNLVAFQYRGNKKNKEVIVDIFRPKSEKELQQPISRRLSAVCPICEYTTPYKRVREQIRQRNGGTNDSRLLAVIMLKPDGSREYRVPNNDDFLSVEKAKKELRNINSKSKESISLIPDEPYPNWYSGVFNPGLWNIKTWGDLFTSRQCLSMITFCRLVKEVHKKMKTEDNKSELADAVATCLALAVSNMSHYSSSVSIYALDHMISAFVQGSGMAMRPDFAEVNPLLPKLVGGLDYSLNQIISVLDREKGISGIGTVQQGTATRLALPNDSVPYVVTDPPYYAAVPYSDLSDFCYVWLRRMLRDIHSDLLNENLTPKDDELVAYYVQPTDRLQKDGKFFESKMQEALAECRRVLQPGGVGLIIFAHKGTAGWEALLNALINAGWTVTASWPIDTERAARMRAKNSAVLGSSVHLVCRPRENLDGTIITDYIGDWRDVLRELPQKIHDWMPRLAKEGVVGADAIFACLGPALEVFSKYSHVEKANGEKVELKEYLEQVWAAVAKEALNMIFEGARTEGFEEDARLTTMWLWTLSTGTNGSSKESDENVEEEADESESRSSKVSLSGFSLEFDAARRIAQGLGAHLENLSGIVEIEGDKARLLSVAERVKILFGKESTAVATRKKKKSDQLTLFEELGQAEEQGWALGDEKSTVGKTVLDRLHQAMILFGAGRAEALKRFLVEEGIGKDERFWRLGQALSALYPTNTDEKRWIDGVLAKKKSLGF